MNAKINDRSNVSSGKTTQKDFWENGEPLKKGVFLTVLDQLKCSAKLTNRRLIAKILCAELKKQPVKQADKKIINS